MFLLPEEGRSEIPVIEERETAGDMISVITPSFNHGGFISSCIESVRKQTYPKFEHVIVDGGSTDETVGILKRYPGLKWVSERDRGQSHALNKAITMARGEYIFWLNADDELLPDALEDAVATFAREGRPDVIVYGFEMINMKGDYIGEKLPGPRMKWKDGLFSPVDCFPTPAIAFRRSVAERIGGFDESIHYPMDTEFLCRARARGYYVLFVDRYAVRYRWDENSKTYRTNSITPLVEQYHVHRRFWPKGIRWWTYWIKSRVLRGNLYNRSFVIECGHKEYLKASVSWMLFLLNQPEFALKKNTWGIFLRALGMRK